VLFFYKNRSEAKIIALFLVFYILVLCGLVLVENKPKKIKRQPGFIFDLKEPVYREQRHPVFINEKPNKGTFIF